MALEHHTGLRHGLLAEISSEPGWRLQPSLPHTPRQGIINTFPFKKRLNQQKKTNLKPNHQRAWKRNDQTSYIQREKSQPH